MVEENVVARVLNFSTSSQNLAGSGLSLFPLRFRISDRAIPLRIEFVGGLWRVTARVDGREDIYLSDANRRLFLGVLSDVVARLNWAIDAYCSMSNHYDQLVEAPDADLFKGVRQLNGV